MERAMLSYSRFARRSAPFLFAVSTLTGVVLLVAPAACTKEINTVGGGGSSNGVGGSAVSTVVITVTVGVSATGVTTGASFSTSTGFQCNAPTPTGTVISMTTSTATGVCSFHSSDAADHQYAALCTAEGCNCLVDGSSFCTCTDNAPTDCTNGCCPSPWADNP